MIDLTIAGAGIVSFVLSISIIPFLIHMSRKKKWFDTPEERKVHTGEISRLAGIGIFLSMAAGLVFGFLYSEGRIPARFPVFRLLPFFAAWLMIHIIGLVDDFKSVRPRYKFIVQIAAALVVISSGRYFSVLYIPFLQNPLDIGYLGSILTFFWIIGTCNAVNFIDGLDGLCGGLSLIASFALAIISIALGSTVTAVIAFALFGSLIGFLVFNFPPAKIFMGDSGSLFLGFVLATLPLVEINRITDMSLIIAISMVFIPVLDTLFAMARRSRRGQSMFYPDREHIHHKLMDRGLSNKKILLVIYTVSAVLCLSVIAWSITRFFWLPYVILAIWLSIFLFFVLLDIRHEENKNPAIGK